MSEADVRNLLHPIPPRAPDEVFETVLERPSLRIERIVSWGHTTAPGEWYDQPQDEWVMVLEGAARLLLEGRPELALERGDSVFLPAGCRHRVTWTADDTPTIWLAVHHWPAPPAASSAGSAGPG
jgi:cupin 2 domain-containing protein